MQELRRYLQEQELKTEAEQSKAFDKFLEEYIPTMKNKKELSSDNIYICPRGCSKTGLAHFRLSRKLYEEGAIDLATYVAQISVYQMVVYGLSEEEVMDWARKVIEEEMNNKKLKEDYSNES